MAGDDALSVVNEGEARIQVGVVAQQGFYELVLEGIVVEERVVRFKEDIGSVFFCSSLRSHHSTAFLSRR